MSSGRAPKVRTAASTSMSHCDFVAYTRTKVGPDAMRSVVDSHVSRQRPTAHSAARCSELGLAAGETVQTTTVAAAVKGWPGAGPQQVAWKDCKRSVECSSTSLCSRTSSLPTRGTGSPSTGGVACQATRPIPTVRHVRESTSWQLDAQVFVGLVSGQPRPRQAARATACHPPCRFYLASTVRRIRLSKQIQAQGEIPPAVPQAALPSPVLPVD